MRWTQMRDHSQDPVECLRRMQNVMEKTRGEMLMFLEQSRSIAADLRLSAKASAERAAHARALARAAVRRADARRQETAKLTAVPRDLGGDDNHRRGATSRVEAGAFEA